MNHVVGWIAIGLAVLSLAPSIVPGAVSMMGLLMSLGALIISIFSVSSKGGKYFNITLIIVFSGVFLVNDALRVWDPLPMPINAKIAMYGVFSLVVVGCVFLARKLSGNE